MGQENLETGHVATFYFKKNYYDFTEEYEFTISNCNFSYTPSGESSENCQYAFSNCTVPANAMYDMLISAGDVTATYTEDAEIRVPISIEQNKTDGYIAGNIRTSWSSSYLKLVDVEYNEEIAPPLEPADITDNLSSYKLSFGDLLATENTSISAPETLATLVFQPLRNDINDVDINITYPDIVNYDLEQIKCGVKNGTVHLRQSGAFYDEETGTLTLRGNVTSYDIHQYMFENGLKKVIAEEGTVLPESCWSLFNGCVAEEIDLSRADTSNVTDMNGMFFYCSNVTSIKLDGFDTSNVTNMSQMFEGCNNLVALDLSSFDTSNVTNMWAMFDNCKKLETLDISSFNTSNVTDMHYMFYGCEVLSPVDVSHFDTHNVVNIYGMFEYCYALSDIDVSGFDMSNVSFGGSMFYGCTALAHKICHLYNVIDTVNSNSIEKTIVLELGSDANRITITDNDTVVAFYEGAEIDSYRNAEGNVELKYSVPFSNNGTIDIYAEDLNGDPMIHTDLAGMYRDVSPVELNKKTPVVGMVYYVGDVFENSGNDYFYHADTNNTMNFNYYLFSISEITYTEDSPTSVIQLSGNITNTISLINPLNKQPLGFKIVSGSGTKSSPFRLEPVYDTELQPVKAKKPTCEFAGNIQFYLGKQSGLFYSENNISSLYENQDDVIIPAIGHEWISPVYEWSEDNSTCTKKWICKHNSSHIKSDTVDTELHENTERGSAYREAVFSNSTKKYAHTSNINDDGVSNGDYSSFLNDIQTITIPGAEKLKVTLKYHTERNYDYLYVYKGVYTGEQVIPDEPPLRSVRSLGASSGPQLLQEYSGDGGEAFTFEVEGDTVTFRFTSDSSIFNYGYYAVVEADIPDVQTKWTKRIDISDGTFIANPITFAYDGEEHSVSGVVKYNGEKLINGKDYILTGNTAVENGTYTAKAEGIGEFEGELNAVWKIVDILNVRVDINGKVSNTTYEAKSSVTVQAPDVDSMKFSHWEANGKKVSTSQVYSFIVLNDVDLKAVYVDESDVVISEPILNIETGRKMSNNKNAIGFTFTHSIPKGYTVQEVGILYASNKLAGADISNPDYAATVDLTGTDFDIETAVKENTSGNIAKYIANYVKNNGTVTFSCAVGSNTECYMYAVGYVKVINAEGQEDILYTDFVATTFTNA